MTIPDLLPTDGEDSFLILLPDGQPRRKPKAKSVIYSFMITQTQTADAHARADAEAVLRHVVSRAPLDPEVYRRVHERAAMITESLRQKHGVLNIAVDLVRSARDEA